MEILLVLTLGYLAILVLALAVSLVAIWFYLHRIGTVLNEVDDALGLVRARSESLEALLSPFEEGTRRTADEMSAAHASLANADRRVREQLERERGVAAAR